MGIFDGLQKNKAVPAPPDRFSAAKEAIAVGASELEAKELHQPFNVSENTPPGVKLLQLARSNAVMTDYQKELFLTALSSLPNEHMAALAAGVTILAARKAKKEDPAFEIAVEMARNISVGMAEEAAFKRAIEGVTRYKYSGDQVIGTEQEYSDGLLAKILAANDPRYENKSNVKAEVNANFNWTELIQAMRDAQGGA